MFDFLVIYMASFSLEKVIIEKKVRKCFKMNGQRYSITHLTCSQSYGGIQWKYLIFDLFSNGNKSVRFFNDKF